MSVKRRPHPNTIQGARFTVNARGERIRTAVPMGTNHGAGRSGETEEKRRRHDCHGNARSCQSHR